MKTKIILLIALVIGLTAATASAQNEKVKSKSNITNNRASVEQTLTANEKQAWKNLVDKKYDAFAAMFAEDYEGVYDYEMTNKTTEMAELKTVTFNSADVSDIKVRFIDEDSAIVTSTVKFTMTMADGMKMSDNVRATTVWAKRGKSWLVVYHSHVTIKTMDGMKM